MRPLKGSEATEEEPKCPKTKERTVGYIIDKVSQWRRLYNGTYDQNFNHQRMSLEDAALEVGVQKKSLDDYLAQLRAGRTYGYDFNMRKMEKVSTKEMQSSCRKTNEYLLSLLEIVFLLNISI